MRKILFYSSGHGFGHATRMIAVVRELLKQDDYKIYFIASIPTWLVLNSFSKESNVEFIHTENDAGVIYGSNLLVDIPKTFNQVKEIMIDQRESYIKKELDFCKKHKIDIINSDIPSLPFIVGKKAEIPTFAISNFNWYDIYKHIFRQDQNYVLTENDLNTIWNDYSEATLFLEMPFPTQNKMFKQKEKIPLVVRKTTRTREDIRKFLNIDEEKELIFVSLGWHNLPENEIRNVFRSLEEISKNRGTTFLVSSILKNYISPKKNYIRFIPEFDTESQDYIASCDLVISKIGYGIVSECVANNIPMIYTIRKNYIEDKLTLKELDKLIVSEYVPAEQFLKGAWINLVEDMLDSKNEYIQKRVNADGARIAARNILEFIK